MRKLPFFPLLFLAVVTMVSGSASAGLLISGGAEGRLEMGMDQSVEPALYYSAAAEYHWQRFFTGLEYFQGAVENTGQASLSLSRQRQGGWITGAWQAANWGFVLPYLRGGLGGYEDSVTTTLLGASSTANSRVYMSGFGGLGLRWNTGNSFFLASEARLIFAENQNPQPSTSVLLRIGWEFGGESPRSQPQINRGLQKNEQDDLLDQ